MINYYDNKEIKLDFSEYKVFSEDKQKFIEAMSYMAMIKSEDLNKEEIKNHIGVIQEFVKSSKSDNNTVNNMFGLKEEFTGLEFGTKEYYFFLADIKIKSVVYLLRIDNFLKNWKSSNTDKVKREAFISDIKNMKMSEVKVFFEISKETEYDTRNFLEISQLDHELLNNAFWKLNESNKNDDKLKLSSQEKDFKEFCQSIINFLKNNNNKEELKKITNLYKKQKRILEEKLDEMLEKKDEKHLNEQLNKIDGIRVSFDYAEKLYSNKDTGLRRQDKDIEYYLFDNSMKEISFCGIEWNWMWKYEKGVEDLFRCVGTDRFVYEGDYNGQKRRIYYQNMIKNIVNHMNKGGNVKLASYSKNPFRDIYKYMISEYENKEEKAEYSFKIKFVNNGVNNVIVELEEKNSSCDNFKPMIFAMIKKANTNIIKKLASSNNYCNDFTINDKNYKCISTANTSFYDYVLGEDDGDEYNFCVDTFNTKENYKGDIRRVFGEYTDSFPGVGVPNHQLSVVASSDKEVVMLGNTCDGIKNDFNLNWNYANCTENIEYRVELNRDEILLLFYKMHKLCKGNKINPRLEFEEKGYFCNEIPVKFGEDNVFNYIREVKSFSKNLNMEERINNIKELSNNTDYKEVPLCKEILEIINQFEETHGEENSQNTNIGNDISKVISNFEKEIKECLKESIIKKVKKVEKVDIFSKKVDFIISFLKESEYKAEPNYGKATYREDEDMLVALFRSLFLQ
ncbi:hypothetical protein [Tissierella praeacuta]|uniref:hypothetical protein n=1 Tax=Tissierella praeacuta TaxID=43131 RepID=UPI0028ABC476|nr:hypothetical protein [Tissierella praeacuta]